MFWQLNGREGIPADVLNTTGVFAGALHPVRVDGSAFLSLGLTATSVHASTDRSSKWTFLLNRSIRSACSAGPNSCSGTVVPLAGARSEGSLAMMSKRAESSQLGAPMI